MTKKDFLIWCALFLLLILAIIFTALAVSGEAQQHATVSVCDDALWKHVYNRERLHVQQACVTVIGTTMDASHGKNKDGCRHEADGDGHCFLFLTDAALQGKYLNEMNIKNEDGSLVFEPICRYRVTQADAQAACKDWQQKLALPPVGSHVAITGAWVLDAQHGHMEIHPVTKIEVVK